MGKYLRTGGLWSCALGPEPCSRPHLASTGFLATWVRQQAACPWVGCCELSATLHGVRLSTAVLHSSPVVWLSQGVPRAYALLTSFCLGWHYCIYLHIACTQIFRSLFLEKRCGLYVKTYDKTTENTSQKWPSATLALTLIAIQCWSANSSLLRSIAPFFFF